MGSRLVTAVTLALSGGLVMAAILWHLDGTLRGTSVLIVAAMLGAGGIGLVTGPLFGWRGFEGIVVALVGALLSTFIGASLGGVVYVVLGTIFEEDVAITAELVFFGLVFAPAFVFDAIASSWAGIVWLLTMLATHVAASTTRPA